MIKQSELLAFLELKEKADFLAAELATAKAALLARDGEKIQKGSLTMSVDVRTSRTFSYESLAKILGRPETDRLKALLPDKASQVLNVRKVQ